MGRFRRGLGLTVAAAVTSTVALAGPAAAGEPLRVRDVTASVLVVAVDGDRTVEVSVERSDIAGRFASATLYGGPGGDHLAEGAGTSEWTDTTFRAEVQLFDDAGQFVGTVAVGGTYAVSGAGDRDQEKFNDGNIHVVMDHTYTPLSASNVTASFDRTAWQVSEADGVQTTGYLFVSDPATYVSGFEKMIITDWTGGNATEFYTDDHGTVDEMFVVVHFGDGNYHAAGTIDLRNRSWDGMFRLYDDEGGSIGRVQASAVVQPGHAVRLFDRVRGGYDRWTYKPYDVELTVDGPLAPAHVTAQLLRLQNSWHTSP